MEEHLRRLCLLLMLFLVILRRGKGQLKENFYESSCSEVENIVQRAMLSKANETYVAIPATLRLLFHDCFVEGCDASILVSSPDNDAERDAEDNHSLDPEGFDAIVRVKRAVEARCPGVVSCADILVMAARDAVFLVGGPSYNVELGRRDGLISRASRVTGNIPGPESNLSQLNAMFARYNLSQTDMIALSGGGHTIGVSYCNRFADRLYSFYRDETVDPTLDPGFALRLMRLCPPDFKPTVKVDLDPATPRKFDNAYFRNLMGGKGVLTSDQVLYADPKSRATVVEFAGDAGGFGGAFVEAVTKLSRVGVKTGRQGEVRRDCTRFNS